LLMGAAKGNVLHRAFRASDSDLRCAAYIALGQSESHARPPARPAACATRLPESAPRPRRHQANGPFIHQGASYGISQFFLFLFPEIVFLQIVFLFREVEPRASREQGRQGEHPEQRRAERARERQGRPQLLVEQPFFAQQQVSD
jgi:hypothetical protein